MIFSKNSSQNEPRRTINQPFQKCNPGYLYTEGKGVDQDWAIAIKWFKKAAAQGFALAQYNLGRLYAEGNGVDQDWNTAIKWFKKAAEQEFAGAQYKLGLLYAEGNGVDQDWAIAIKWFKKAAEQEFAAAQYKLGLLYAEGNGVDQDWAIAIKWFKKAAEQEFAAAQYKLGLLYAEGKCVDQDWNTAFQWFKKAAEQGGAAAQFYLGCCYATGKGVPVDKSTDELANQLRIISEKTGNGIPADNKNAIDYFTKAAQSDLSIAALPLAFLLKNDHSIDSNSDQWLSKAAVNQLPTELLNSFGSGLILYFGEQITEYLQEKAKTFLPAKVVLAHLIDANCFPQPLENTSVQLLDKASKHDDLAALYYRGVKHLDNQETEQALKCFQRIDQEVKKKNNFVIGQIFLGTNSDNIMPHAESIYSPDLQNWLAMFAQEKINAIREQQHQAELIKAEQEKREALEGLMSMFAHKFRGPLDSIVYNLGHQSDIRLYQQAASTMRGLLDIFSLISTDAEKLKTRLKKDTPGEGSLQQVFTHALMYLIQQLLTTEGREKIRQHYWAYAVRNQLVPTGTTRLNWLEDYEHIEAQLKNQWEAEWGELLKSTPNLEQLQHWIGKHLAPITVAGFTQESIRFQLYGATHSFLTIVLNELLLNAFKYYDSPECHPVQIEWSAESGFWLLRLINPSTRTERRNTKGSGKGHQFLGLLAKRIDGRFDQPKFQNTYTAEFFFPYWSFATAE
jgi:TPR repeat protein